MTKKKSEALDVIDEIYADIEKAGIKIRKRKKLKQNAGEQAVAAQLVIARADFTFEPHSFHYTVPTTYTPDFAVQTKNGPMYIEVKGYHPGMAIWCSKIKRFLEQYPEIDFRIVFLDAKKKFNKRYKSNLGDWATKAGIKWADKGILPKEWLNEA